MRVRPWQILAGGTAVAGIVGLLLMREPAPEQGSIVLPDAAVASAVSPDAAPAMVAVVFDAGVPAAPIDATVAKLQKASNVNTPPTAPTAPLKPSLRSPEAWTALEGVVLVKWFTPAQVPKASQALHDMCDTMYNLARDFAEMSWDQFSDGGVEVDKPAWGSALTERAKVQDEAAVELAKLSGGKFNFKEMRWLLKQPEFGRACPNVGINRGEEEPK